MWSRKWAGIVPWIGSGVIVVLVACGGQPGKGARPESRPARAEQPSYELKPTERLEVSEKLLDSGKEVYSNRCATCHGEAGDGTGEAAYLLYPKPRDFVAARYRLVSTWEGVPTDEDLYFTISRGMPGSAMPAWSHLSERKRWALVHYIKSFARRPIVIKESRPPQAAGEEGEGFIEVPPEPAYGEVAQLRAKELFLEGCAGCHGPTGRGDGQQKQVDSEGFPIRPRDLTKGIFKGSWQPEDLYRHLMAGLKGSPMPSSSWAYGDEAWHLVHFSLSLSSVEQREKMEMRRFLIRAARLETVPVHPDDGRWREATPVNLHLMPLWWRDDRPELLTVRALHDGKEVSLLLVWSDETHDHTAIRPQDFRDACAVEFSTDPDPPFFGMGQSESPVSIWMWKSERQADMEPAYQDLEKIYPNIGIDSYPNLLAAPYEQPTRNALTLESDPTFVTAWGAGNIVADPTRKKPVERLSATGMGTLRARPAKDQSVEATGVHATGTYRVVFRRALKGTGSPHIEFIPGRTVSVSFAVWNGSAGDRDGKKSVTIWQEVQLED